MDPASGHLSPSEGGVASGSSEAEGAAEAAGGAASEVLPATEESSGDGPEGVKSVHQHTFEVTIATVGDELLGVFVDE